LTAEKDGVVGSTRVKIRIQAVWKICLDFISFYNQ
jgi:hypothetical protein